MREIQLSSGVTCEPPAPLRRAGFCLLSSLHPSRGLSARAVGAPRSQALPASCPCVCSQVGGCTQGSALNPGHTRTTPAPPATSPGSSEKPHSLGSVRLSDTDLWSRAGAGAENQEGNKEAIKTGRGWDPNSNCDQNLLRACRPSCSPTTVLTGAQSHCMWGDRLRGRGHRSRATART